MAEAQDPKIGAVLEGRYRVVQRIASGGMGSVYRGERLQLERPVAIKFLHAWIAGEADALERFNREARAMSRLAHPSCVSVIDFGVHLSVPYLVMDYATGRTLRSVLREERSVAPPRAIAITRQVLAGLGHAHGQGIVHRDVKPDNIVLGEVTGLGLQARILDFGVAKLRDMQTGLTVGMAVGTPAYMAPEQTLGEPVDARTDVYATGVVLFEMLAGRKLFDGESAHEIVRKQRVEPAPPLREAAPGLTLSAALEAAVARALAKAPGDRFQSAADFAAALEAAPEARAAPDQPPRAPAPPPPRARRRWPALVAAGILVAGSAGAWLAFSRRGGDASSSDAGEHVLAAAIVKEEPQPVVAPPPPPRPSELAGLDQARLTELRKRQPENAEVAYRLANLYLDKLWGEEGFEAARAAVKLEPSYREDAKLIKNAINMLVSDTHAGRAMRFLRDDIGAPAIPYLTEARKSKSLNISRRADQLLRSIKPR